GQPLAQSILICVRSVNNACRRQRIWQNLPLSSLEYQTLMSGGMAELRDSGIMIQRREGEILPDTLTSASVIDRSDADKYGLRQWLTAIAGLVSGLICVRKEFLQDFIYVSRNPY
ncbi:hypothetical protein, partial [Thalassolituus sp.]|uniref:hypothetical protein n=1 Tax=Thalassolituus sp. TaxID=2030822 RepID=UPI003516B8F4